MIKSKSGRIVGPQPKIGWDTFGEVITGEKFYRWADRELKRYCYRKTSHSTAVWNRSGREEAVVFEASEEVYRPMLADLNKK